MIVSSGRGRGGFTLVEMLVVVAIIALLAGIAVYSLAGNKAEDAVNRFANEIQNAMKEARSRAVATGKRYVVEVKPGSVQWCEGDCPPLPAAQRGTIFNAKDGAKAVSYAKAADLCKAPSPTKVSLAGSFKVHFLGDGTVDSDIATPTPDGFTVYLNHDDGTAQNFWVTVIPLSGDIRKWSKCVE